MHFYLLRTYNSMLNIDFLVKIAKIIQSFVYLFSKFLLYPSIAPKNGFKNNCEKNSKS